MLIYPTILTTQAVGIGVDLYGTVWFYDWVRISLESGELSGFTNWFFYPDGKDIFSHTGSNIIDAILSIPFQWIFGERYFGIFIAFLMALNVATLRRLLVEFQVSQFAVLASSIVWVLNPFVISELNLGRPTQILLFPSFIALTIWHRMLTVDDVSSKDKMLLGCSVALQGWCYWFYGMFLVLFLTMYSLFYSRGSFNQIRMMIGRVWISILVCVLCILPAFLSMVNSAQQGDVPGVMDVASMSMREMSEQLVPWIRGYHLQEPLGHPLIRTWLLGAMTLVIILSRTISSALLAASLLLWMVATGPWMSGGDTPYLNWFYLWLMKWVPFFERLWFPYRAMSYVWIGTVIGFAHSFSVITQQTSRLQRFGLISGLMLVGLGDLVYVRSFPLTHTETKPSSVIQCIEGPYIELPIGFAHPSMMWQGQIRHPSFGGMGENGLTFLPQGYLNRLQNPFIEALKSKSLIVNSRKQFSPFDKDRVVAIGFEYVLWDRSITEQERMKRSAGSNRPLEVFGIQEHLVDILGEPICENAQYLVFSLLDTALPSDMEVSPQWTWAVPVRHPYEERLRELGRVPD